MPHSFQLLEVPTGAASQYLTRLVHECEFCGTRAASAEALDVVMETPCIHSPYFREEHDPHQHFNVDPAYPTGVDCVWRNEDVPPLWDAETYAAHEPWHRWEVVRINASTKVRSYDKIYEGMVYLTTAKEYRMRVRQSIQSKTVRELQAEIKELKHNVAVLCARREVAKVVITAACKHSKRTAKMVAELPNDAWTQYLSNE